MHVVLGGTGHVGSALVSALLARGEPVTVVTRDASKRAAFNARGVEVAVLDLHDASALQKVLKGKKRAFLLNPPAPPESEDAAREEQHTVAAIVSALRGSRLEGVVAASTYGAQPGDSIGDLGVLCELEQALRAQSIPAAIVRSAYYMSNWDFALESARECGTIPSLYPADFALPMVAPRDIAHLVAELLTRPIPDDALHFIEGPAEYTPRDVAAALGALLDRPVAVDVIPEDGWQAALEFLGFSPKSAASMAAMTRLTLHGPKEAAVGAHRGPTTLREYLQDRLSRWTACESASNKRSRIGLYRA